MDFVDWFWLLKVIVPPPPDSCSSCYIGRKLLQLVWNLEMMETEKLCGKDKETTGAAALVRKRGHIWQMLWIGQENRCDSWLKAKETLGRYYGTAVAAVLERKNHSQGVNFVQ